MSAEITLAELPLRPELIGEEPYGAPQLDVPIRLNVNENPHRLSAKLRQQMGAAIADLASDLNQYPDREALQLRAALADYLGFGLTREQIWVANGSNEVMTHLLLAFGGPGRTLLSFSPTYSMYREYARNTHTRYVEVPRSSGFMVDAELALAAAKEHQADVLVITSPNNPTGTATPVAVIRDICQSFDGIVIVDEAYQEFADVPEDSAIALLPAFGKLVVTRTMSKAFAFAGGRLGYLAAAPAVVDACRIVRLPYHLAAHSQALALVAIANASELLQNVDQLRCEREDLTLWLRSQGLQVVPSQANFVLFGRFADRHSLWQQLLERGILIREVGPPGYLRVSAGTAEQMAAFKAAMQEILPTAQLLSVTESEVEQ